MNSVNSSMATDGCDWAGRWNHVRKILERTGPFAHPEFEASPEVSTMSTIVHNVVGLNKDKKENAKIKVFHPGDSSQGNNRNWKLKQWVNV